MRRLSILISVLVISIIICIAGFLAYNQTKVNVVEKKLAGLPTAELLKAPKEKVLTSLVVNRDGKEEVNYYYATDVVPALTNDEGVVEDMSKRTTNSNTFILDRKLDRVEDTPQGKVEHYIETRQTRFLQGIPFVKSSDEDWYQTEFATTTKEAYDIQMEKTPLDIARDMIFDSTFAVTTIYYPTSTTAIDGEVQRINATGESWSTMISEAGTDFDDSSTNFNIFRFTSDTTLNEWRLNNRSIVLFDTSALPEDWIVSNIYLRVFTYVKIDQLLITPSILIVSSTPASNTALENADYSQLGKTAYSSAFLYSSMSGSNKGANSIYLNAAGYNEIIAGGITKLGLMNYNYDFIKVAPTATTTLKYSAFTVYSARYTGTTYDPWLVITYTLPVVANPPSQESDFWISEE